MSAKMPVNIASKLTSEAGPSNNRQAAAGGGQEPLGIGENRGAVGWVSITGPGGERQFQPNIIWPNGKKEQLPILPAIPMTFGYGPLLDARNAPEVVRLTITLHVFSMYVCHMWYEYLGRLLVREEVVGIMRMVFHGSQWVAQKGLLERFDNPTDGITIAFRRVTDAVKDTVREEWCRHVDGWFQHFRAVDPAAKVRAEELYGFIGRPPLVLDTTRNYTTRRDYKVNAEQIEPYQACTHYGVVNWGTNRDNEKLREEDTRKILGHYYNWKSPGPIRLSVTFADPTYQATKNVALVANDPKYKPFFKTLSEQWISKYEVEVLGLKARPNTEIASQSGLVSATTSSLGALSLTATASSSSQRTTSGLSQLTDYKASYGFKPMIAPGPPSATPSAALSASPSASPSAPPSAPPSASPSASPSAPPSESSSKASSGKGKEKETTPEYFRQFTDYDDYARSESAGSPPPPGKTTSDDPANKGKGKARRRESSSNSPPKTEKGKGKGKEKVEKRQRRD